MSKSCYIEYSINIKILSFLCTSKSLWHNVWKPGKF